MNNYKKICCKIILTGLISVLGIASAIAQNTNGWLTMAQHPDSPALGGKPLVIQSTMTYFPTLTEFRATTRDDAFVQIVGYSAMRVLNATVLPYLERAHTFSYEIKFPVDVKNLLAPRPNMTTMEITQNAQELMQIITDGNLARLRDSTNPLYQSAWNIFINTNPEYNLLTWNKARATMDALNGLPQQVAPLVTQAINSALRIVLIERGLLRVGRGSGRFIPERPTDLPSSDDRTQGGGFNGFGGTGGGGSGGFSVVAP